MVKALSLDMLEFIDSIVEIGGELTKEELRDIKMMISDVRPLTVDQLAERDAEIARQQDMHGISMEMLLEPDWEDSKSEEAQEKILDWRTELAKMDLKDKIKVALFGNEVCRSILIRGGNKMIAMCVLKNPKLREKEIEIFTKNPQMNSMVLRNIADNKAWMKNYSIKLSMVTNPKTPIDVAIHWLKFINVHDLKKIARSKNIPTAVTTLAKKRLARHQTV